VPVTAALAYVQLFTPILDVLCFFVFELKP